MSDVIRHVAIRGRVQGVGYRYWTEHTATSLGLQGWVRNRRDGSVEAVFAGSSAVVEQMIAECRRGPISSRVDAVDVTDAGADMLKLRGAGDGFAMLPTL
ncbi:acylphosphatase [Tardiphaga robiniae]|uniref:acylphosphatase n=1 Tax=Tardiphaga robiniae TaxID=943830 RepID=A0A161STJ7_9BRAD|nr:acylphosphatase [Tardiphaga robiniae]KZD24822.1 acylphosphatase [Tardiphaga robiniae]